LRQSVFKSIAHGHAGVCPAWYATMQAICALPLIAVAIMTRRGLRSTEQRRVIIDTFFGSTEHITIDTLLREVRAVDARVGYATVYRTMKLLTESGVVQEHKFGDGFTRYELSDDDAHHDHLICMECGKITEFEEPAIEELQHIGIIGSRAQQSLIRRGGFPEPTRLVIAHSRLQCALSGWINRIHSPVSTTMDGSKTGAHLQSEPESLLTLARQEMAAGHLQAAQAKCLQVLGTHQRHAGALSLLGRILSMQGRQEEAVQVFNAVTLVVLSPVLLGFAMVFLVATAFEHLEDIAVLSKRKQPLKELAQILIKRDH